MTGAGAQACLRMEPKNPSHLHYGGRVEGYTVVTPRHSAHSQKSSFYPPTPRRTFWARLPVLQHDFRRAPVRMKSPAEMCISEKLALFAVSSAPFSFWRVEAKSEGEGATTCGPVSDPGRTLGEKIQTIVVHGSKFASRVS